MLDVERDGVHMHTTVGMAGEENAVSTGKM